MTTDSNEIEEVVPDIHDPLTRETQIAIWYHQPSEPEQGEDESDHAFDARQAKYNEEWHNRRSSDTVSRNGVRSLYINNNIVVDLEDDRITVHPVNGEVLHVKLSGLGIAMQLNALCVQYAKESREGFARARRRGHPPQENPPPTPEAALIASLQATLAEKDKVIASLLESYDLLVGEQSPINDVTKDVVRGFFVRTEAAKRRWRGQKETP